MLGVILCIYMCEKGGRYGDVRICSGKHRRPIAGCSAEPIEGRRLHQDFSREDQLKSDAATEASKNQLSRDFWGCSIFDFCNSIGPTPTSGDVCFCAAVGKKADVAIAAVEPMIDLDGRRAHHRHHHQRRCRARRWRPSWRRRSSPPATPRTALPASASAITVT